MYWLQLVHIRFYNCQLSAKDTWALTVTVPKRLVAEGDTLKGLCREGLGHPYTCTTSGDFTMPKLLSFICTGMLMCRDYRYLVVASWFTSRKEGATEHCKMTPIGTLSCA